MSHIQNFEAKVTSTKQVSEAGNHDMPQRALKENPRLGYTAFFNHSSCKALHNISKARILWQIHFLTTAYTVCNTGNNRLQGLHAKTKLRQVLQNVELIWNNFKIMGWLHVLQTERKSKKNDRIKNFGLVPVSGLFCTSIGSNIFWLWLYENRNLYHKFSLKSSTFLQLYNYQQQEHRRHFL